MGFVLYFDKYFFGVDFRNKDVPNNDIGKIIIDIPFPHVHIRLQKMSQIEGKGYIETLKHLPREI